MATQISSPELSIPRQLPATMRAVVYRGINDMRIETVPVPEIGAGELLVKIATCGICGTDLKKVHYGSHSAPRIFGHEMSGIVVARGEGVTKFELGERVVVHHHVPCYECYYCRKGTPAQCPLYKKTGVTAGFEPSGGGFAEYIRVMDFVVNNGGVVKIPDGVPFEQAAFVEPVNTVLKGVKMLDLRSDDTVLVIGQGPIGLMHAALCLRTGAKVLTSDLYPERHAIAARFGLKHPIDAGKENVVERVFAESEGRGADAVILAVGGKALIKTAMDACRPGGKVMLFAQTQHEEAIFDPGAVCMDEKTLMGSYSSSFDILDEVTDLVFNGYRNGFDLTQLISHRFQTEDAVAGIDIASHPKADSMKIMIEPVLGAGAQ
ncbi:zinc-dependent dehydrogenase [Occallatibacter riparius]|uniref:Zinc-dependent dehydrogenase n=1 Tax=Occallatibacter riparius TaxID=1002689 RepID=A0A9J7BLW0_9BACT|nr:zinc-dependent dehydrogenase [Occallatibacter riparius]UWZ81886.1 zinc-dependent dehydrogenase [Occallatibacter riparius]